MAILPTSPRQDRGGVRTAADLERKYDLSAILGTKKAVLLNEQQLTKTNKILEDFVKSTLGTLENMQSQIDGNITTWFDYGQPTLTTYPANEWITDEMKINHIGDLYYDRNTGYAYRYENTKDGTYNWEKIKDNDVVEALAIANAAADTADSKRRVFVAKPVPPYDSGDLWFTSEGEIYICQISKDSGQVYADKDFIVATKYTDDTYAKQVGQELTVVKGTVTTIKEGMDEFSVEISVLENDILLAQTQIEANTEEIELRVTKDGIISAINVSSEEILIDAKKINLVGAVTLISLSTDVKDEFDTIKNTANNASSAATTANTNATSALNRATYHYGTCVTAAATAAKVVALTGFALYTGAQVTVQFTYANTAANPKLNVNGTGAKYIRVNNANITAPYYWGANNTVTFTYNGTYWIMSDTCANSIVANWASTNDRTYINGGKIYAKSVTANKIDIEDLFAQEILATGSITGATLISYSKDSTQKVVMKDGMVELYSLDTRGEGGYRQTGAIYPASIADTGASGHWIFDGVETISGNDLDVVASKLEVSTTSRLTTANANISELKTVTKKMGNVYVVTVEFKPTANISAFSGIFKVSDDIATSSLVLPIPAVCWDDGSTAWFYQQYNNIMNRTALVSGKWYEFTFTYVV